MTDLDETFPDDLFSENITERFFDMLFNGDREIAKAEILALLDLQGDRNDKMIEIMTKIAGGCER
ncbi:MAG: hypothetical protein LBI57_02225 [Helicobacteraceae bacterium]|jgi:hypothetical protein|nr:hypothetical protein [Helicobacteraceae bacterium]